MTERRNKYSRTLEDPLGYERHGMTSVRDREAPGSNPGPPTIFVFKIGAFGPRPEPPGHSRGTILWGTIVI